MEKRHFNKPIGKTKGTENMLEAANVRVIKQELLHFTGIFSKWYIAFQEFSQVATQF